MITYRIRMPFVELYSEKEGRLLVKYYAVLMDNEDVQKEIVELGGKDIIGIIMDELKETNILPFVEKWKPS